MSDTQDQLLVIPFPVNPTQFSVFIALQDSNLERMRQYDPAELNIPDLLQAGHAWIEGHTLRDVIIGYATDADLDEFVRLTAAGHFAQGMQHLSRGFRYRPERGDHDRGPERHHG